MSQFRNRNNALVWQQAWRFSIYRTYLFIGLTVLAASIIGLPFFFHHIQDREGAVLNDHLLSMIPAVDMTIPIFVIIWIVISYGIVRSLQDPQNFLITLYSVIFVCIFRYISIYLVALDPPVDLIPIRDPISNLCYGGHANFITKDLFFSGHTSSMFLCYLCLNKKVEKTAALIATVLIGCMVLVQHVHYTMDVVAAPFFTYLAYALSKKITAINI